MEPSEKVDDRVLCKYGPLCYQKNEAHHKKYKHEKKASPHRQPVKDVQVKEPPLPEAKEDDKSLDSGDSAKAESSNSVDSPPSKKQKTDASSRAGDEQPMSQMISKEEAKTIIKKMFLVEMPDDFYAFWDLCVFLNPKKPLDAFKDCKIRLVGPFEVLAGVLKESKHQVPATLHHWRYFFDPPEFQTVICGDDRKGEHWGYYRDDPKEMPTFVASNCATQDCIIKDAGPNLFAVMDFIVASQLKSADPFSKMKFKKLNTALQSKAKEENINLHDKSAFFARKRKVVCPTFHKGGIVVEYNKKTQVGYRQMETEVNLRKVLDKIANAETEERRDKEMEALDSLITYANIANDECDFGGPLELGINLFCDGHEIFHPQVEGILISTYHLLNRSQFADILKAHISSGRKRGTDLSIL
ncbi:histone PARylation factor 1 [Neocloeon triangulifer]|uniref:histone PARylation factor 1 n=1 Tax=Neocloeon triangulifer TaxID=2078957 RepID=UPI00286F4785|nr:histone PARylation factor 1 [Neocloeon triangulifer]